MTELAAVEVTARDGIRIASVRGEIDLSNADSILRTLIDAIDKGSTGLIVDLGACDYLDSAGVRLLFRLGKTLAESGGLLHAVVPMNAQIRRVLDLADIGQVLALDETVAAAVDALQRYEA